MSLRHIGLLVAGLALVSVGGSRVSAHDGPHDSASSLETIKEKLLAIDGTLAKAGTLIAQVGDAPTADVAAPSTQLVSSMRTLLVEMHRLRSAAGGLVNEPGFHDHRAAMEALEKASRDFEKMTSAFQSMTKNVGEMNKEVRRTAQR